MKITLRSLGIKYMKFVLLMSRFGYSVDRNVEFAFSLAHRVGARERLLRCGLLILEMIRMQEAIMAQHRAIIKLLYARFCVKILHARDKFKDKFALVLEFAKSRHAPSTIQLQQRLCLCVKGGRAWRASRSLRLEALYRERGEG